MCILTGFVSLFCSRTNFHALTSYFTNWVESSKFIAFKSTGSSIVANAKQRRVSRPAQQRQSINRGHTCTTPHHLPSSSNVKGQYAVSSDTNKSKGKMWIHIAPCREHTSKALRYGMRSQGISQFYLHTLRSSANGMNHTCLCLLS